MDTHKLRSCCWSMARIKIRGSAMSTDHGLRYFALLHVLQNIPFRHTVSLENLWYHCLFITESGNCEWLWLLMSGTMPSVLELHTYDISKFSLENEVLCCFGGGSMWETFHTDVAAFAGQARSCGRIRRRHCASR
jgi:hypothetical protein